MRVFRSGKTARTAANAPGPQANARSSAQTAPAAGNSRGSQLAEFAMALPLLILMVAGVLDMATAFGLKQKLTNAAREGARMGASQSGADITETRPASVGTIRDTVVAYLNQANVNTSFIGSSMASGGAFTWTYYSTGTTGLKIERAVAAPDTGGGVIISTRVTLSCPYNWTYGFDRVVGTGSGTVMIVTGSVMPNVR